LPFSVGIPFKRNLSLQVVSSVKVVFVADRAQSELARGVRLVGVTTKLDAQVARGKSINNRIETIFLTKRE
jgi:uncharacterized protein with PIN domain